MHTTRFAPSPTGALHLGHVHAALFARGSRRDQGRFLLRIENIDPVRCRVEHEAAIMADLRWLGLDWQHPVRRQSEHLGAYRAVLDALAARGLLYPCFCTRAEIAAALGGTASPAPASAPGDTILHAPHGEEALYPGTCRRLDPGMRRDRLARGARPMRCASTWRRRCAFVSRRLSRSERGEGRVECHPERFGDVVLGRRDVPASYHLCVTHDDALQGVDLVTRANRPASGHGPAPVAAGADGLAGAGLRAPRPGARCCGPAAFEARRGADGRLAAGGRRHAGHRARAWRGWARRWRQAELGAVAGGADSWTGKDGRCSDLSMAASGPRAFGCLISLLEVAVGGATETGGEQG